MELPKVTVYDMGGTIGGEAASPEQTAVYQPGVRSIKALIEDVPELRKIAQLRVVEQIANVGSPDITPNHLLGLTQKIKKELDGDTQGVVVTHGTDTIVWTAWFFELTINSDKPVVVVGAMRPATAYSPDGPMNFLCAATLAASQLGKERGVMIVIDGKIYRPRFTTKTGTNSPAFEATGPGHLGEFYNSQPIFYCEPCRPIGHFHFDVATNDPNAKLPAVEILHFYPGVRPDRCREAFKGGAMGVVLAGAGSGCWSTEAGNAIAAEARARNIPVVASRQPLRGFVGGSGIYGLGGLGDFCIGGGFLSPEHCLVLLQLALMLGFDFDAIKSIFKSNRPGVALFEHRGGASIIETE